MTMSSLSEDEIRSLARLARLALTDDEVRSLQGELSSILSHMQTLSELDTTGVAPMTHVMPTIQALRADEAGPSLDRERVLAASARTDGESFAVPAILPSGES
jgi:aspartyl-tRNA(Asn)/glutamyl-tRNA(Gln) amidotransferase subunit C